MSIIPNYVVSLSNRIDHDPDGIQTDFPFDFQVNATDLMYVYADGADYLEEFSITGLGDPVGGVVSFTVAPDGAISILTLMRILPLTQEVVYPVYGPFPAKSHESALDKLTWITQQMDEELGRALKMPINGEPEAGILPPPAPGYTLVWNVTGSGFDNAPGEESFLSWVNRAEEAATISEEASVNAYLWAQEDEDVPVDDGVHPSGFSAYHWAKKAEEGGIIDIFSDDELMLRINTPDPRYRSIEPIVGSAGGMVKLDNNNYIPLEHMPFDGSIRFIAPIEGHNRCPKYQYQIPDETACVEPDTRNPSERVPSVSFLSGDWFATVQCDEEPLLNQMNLINPETQLYEIQSIVNGDGIIYLDGADGVTAAGWYRLERFVGDDEVFADSVIFNDSTTIIKGVNVQVWNQAADASIDSKYNKSGGQISGDVILSNAVRLRSHNNDVSASYDLIQLTSNNHIYIGGSAEHIGEVRIYQNAAIALRILENEIITDRKIRLPHGVSLQATTSGGQVVNLVHLNSADEIYIGGSPDALNTLIYATDTLALKLEPTAATFSGAISTGGSVFFPNDESIFFRNMEDTEWSQVMRLTSGNNLVINDDALGLNLILYANGVRNISCNAGNTLFDKPTVHPRIDQNPVAEAVVDFALGLHQSLTISEATNIIFFPPPVDSAQVAHCYLRIVNSSLYPTTYPVDVQWLNGEAPKAPAEHTHTIISMVYDSATFFGAVGEFYLAP